MNKISTINLKSKGLPSEEKTTSRCIEIFVADFGEEDGIIRFGEIAAVLV